MKSITINGNVRTILEVQIKSPKEQRIGTGVKLEIFDNGTFLCPVKAFQNWISLSGMPTEGLPLFRDEFGYCYTGASFNKDLSIMTSVLTEGTNGLIKPHSFRSAIATEMAKRGFFISRNPSTGTLE